MSKQKISILSGDIGGTNSRLSLLKISSDPDEPHELIDNKYLFSSERDFNEVITVKQKYYYFQNF